MINDYLERDAPIADDNLLLVIQAVAALHRAQVVDGVALLKKFPNRFGPQHQEDVERIWRNYALVPEELKGIFLQSVISSVLRNSLSCKLHKGCALLGVNILKYFPMYANEQY